VSVIHSRRGRFRLLAGVLLFLLTLGLAAACGDDDNASGETGSDDTSGTGDTGGGSDVTLKLGYFPNVTHAPAIVGVEKGFYEDALAGIANLETSTYSQGSEASEALLSGAIDATFIGPNPAINAYAQSLSDGGAIRIVSGSTSGGAALVVSPDITEPSQLEGKTLATPSLGNTQDVALRAWLKDQGFETDEAGGGDVHIVNQENSDTLNAFVDGQIQGAWVPEPWATRLVEEGNGHVLVDEADLWPDGQFVTTHLIVNTDYLNDHPDVIKALLEGHKQAVDFTNDSPEEAQAAVVSGISEITGQDVSPDLIANSWKNLTFTLDPIASSLFESAQHAEDVGLLDPVDLDGIYDLTLLNEVLTAAGESEVSDT
jgi:sulfonate transport system substrate-binding protein